MVGLAYDTVIILPHFEMPNNVNHLRVSMPYFVDIVSKCLNNGFKSINTWYRISAKSFDEVYEFFDKVSFLFTVLG